MSRRLIPTYALLLLTALAVVLPIIICVLLALGRLLEGMGDATGGRVLDAVALGVGVLWVVDLIGLVLSQAVNSLIDPTSDSTGPTEELEDEEVS